MDVTEEELKAVFGTYGEVLCGQVFRYKLNLDKHECKKSTVVSSDKESCTDHGMTSELLP